MKTFLRLAMSFAFIVFFVTSLNAQCFTNQLVEDDWVYNSDHLESQTWTAECSGDLQEVEFWPHDEWTSGTTITFTLRDYNSCTDLWTVPGLPVTPGEKIVVDLLTGSGTSKTVTSGTKYFLAFHSDQDVGQSKLTLSVNNPYTGGSFGITDQNGNTWCNEFNNNWDLWFRTAIDQPLSHFSFTASDETVELGNDAAVQFSATDFNDIVSFQYTITWDPTKLTYVGTQNYALPGLDGTNFGTSQVGSGILTVSWSDPDASGETLADGAPIFEVLLTGDEGGTHGVDFDNSPTPIEVTDLNGLVEPVDTYDGTVFVNPCPIGDIVLTTQQEVDYFPTMYPGCTELGGSLTIGPSTNITNLNALNVITGIPGGLVINDNLMLTDMTGLGNVDAIGTAVESIIISQNPLLTTVDLSGASAPSLFDILVNTNEVLTDLLLPTDITNLSNDFEINLNPALSNISEHNNLNSIGGHLQIHTTIDPVLPEFSNLVSIGEGLVIYENFQITALPAFPSLTSLQGGGIHISYNPLLQNINLGNVSAPNLAHVTIAVNDVLTDLILPPDITTTTGNFDVNLNPLLANISEQDNLMTIGGSLQLHTTIDPILPEFPNLVSIGNGLIIYDNDLITALPPFVSLVNILGGAIHISFNPLLTTIDLGNISAPSLAHVTIARNDVLTNIVLPPDITTTSGNFDINLNPLLANISEQDDLTTIGGSLQLHTTIDPVLPEFPNLESIGNGLIVYNNDLITSLPPFLSLADIFGGSIHISFNPLLPDIDLGSISAPDLSHVTIAVNDVLTDIILPPDITTTSGNFDINLNPLLDNISEQDNLISIGGSLQLHTTIDPVLPQFPNLVSIGNSLIIYDNDLITDLPPFASLTDIFGGSIFISFNPLISEIDLLTVSAPDLVHITIGNNDVLSDLLLPEDISTISSHFNIVSNPDLTFINDQSNLISVGNYIQIHTTVLCELPAFPVLESIGTNGNANNSGLTISNNSYLTEFTDFPNLITLDSNLTITGNPYLSDCAIDAICDYLPTPKNRNISNNTGDCLDEPAVQNHCDNGPTALPIEFPADMTVVQGSIVTLTITNLPAGYEAIWYDDPNANPIYQSTNNNFEYQVNQAVTLYGAYAPVGSGCISELEPVELMVLPLTFYFSDETTFINNTADVRFEVTSFIDMISFQYTVTWDPTKLTYNSLQNIILPDFFTYNDNDAGNGTLNISWFDGDSSGETYPDGTALFDINFTANELGTHTVSFSDNPIPIEASNADGVIPVTTADGSVLVCDDLVSAPTNVPSDPIGAIPGLNFQYVYGNSLNNNGGIVRKLADESYLIASTSSVCDNSDKDILLLNTNCSGDILWSQTYGGAGEDRIQWGMNNNIQVDSGGNFVVVGTTTSFGAGGRDVYFFKTDPQGNMLWSKTFGGTGEDYGRNVRQTSDGGYIIVGHTTSNITQAPVNNDVYVIKTDIDGNVEWQEQYNLDSYDDGYTIVETVNSDFLISGQTSPGATVYLLKIDASGNLISWNNILPGIGYNLEATDDGGFILCGREWTNDDAFLMKFDSDGNNEWANPVVYTDPAVNYAYCVQQTSSGGYLVSGEADLGAGGGDMWLFETDANGTMMWQNTYGGTLSDVSRSLQKDNNGDFILGGNTRSFGQGLKDLWLLTINENTVPDFNLDPASVTIVKEGDQATLILENYPAGAEVVWYDDEDQTNILYSNTDNLFEPTVTEPTIFYGAYLDPDNCPVELLPVLVKVYPALSLETHYTASQCAEVGSGTATVFARGGAQSIGTGQFTSREQGERPQWGTRSKSADFDGDGDLDVSSGTAGYPLTFWLNNGDATFTESFQFDYSALGGSAGSHALGDLDGDGDIDVFTTDQGYQWTVLFNDGNANFTPSPSFHFNRFKFVVELGDLDGDGDLDALEVGHGANSSTHELRPWFNDGAGNFTQGTIYYPAIGSQSNSDMVLADLDSDGDLDAYLPQFSINSGGGDEVWYNDGTGQFTKSVETYGINDNSFQVAGADMDADGDVDIFVSNHLSPSRVYLNDGDGTFTDSGETYGDNCCGAGEVELADFTCDGILDAVIGRVGSGSTLVYSGDGDGTFTLLEDLLNTGEGGNLAAGTIGVDVGDYDNDGDNDIAAGRIHGLGTIYLNDQRNQTPYTYQWDDPNNQTTATATNLLPGTYNVTVTDADGDMETATVEINGPPALNLDMSSTDATCDLADDGTATATVSGGPDFTIKSNGEQYLITDEIPDIDLGDLDGDGDLDIFNTNLRTSALDKPDRVWFNNGDGTFVESTETYSQGLITGHAVLGDLDNDGDLDAFQSGFGNKVVLHNDGDGTFTFIESIIDNPGGIVQQDYNALGLGDMNGDGFLDAVVGSAAYQSLRIYINDGDGTFTLDYSHLFAEGIKSLELGDLDGDGDLDVFAAGNYISNVVYFNDGTGQMTLGDERYGGNNRFDDVGLADFDSDGDLDAFISGIDGKKNMLLHNDGDGTFTEMQRNWGEYGSTVNIGDLDGDSHLDVFTSSYFAGSSIFLNDGNGLFEDFPQSIPPGSSGVSDIGDLDGDGDLDLVYGQFGQISISINQPNCFEYQWSGNAGGQTTSTITDLGPGNYSVTVTDASGCKVYGSVMVESNGLECNPTATVDVNNSCEATVTVNEILPDPTVCDGLLTFTIFDENGDEIISGAPPLTFNYSPYYGQTLTVEARETGTDNFCTTSLTVNDGIAPSIACPMNLTIECSDSQEPANTGEPIVLDNCDPNPSITYMDDIMLDGCGDYTGTILRTWTAMDGAGNSNTCTQIITVEDNTDPTFTAPGNITIECDQDYTDLTITGDVSNVDDNCDDDPIVTFNDNVNLDGCGGYTGTVTRIWSVTDECGNDAGAIQIITIQDSTGPEFTVPADVTLTCNADPNDLDLTGDVDDLSDNCDTDASIDYMDDETIGGCEGGIIERTWVSKDACGNQNIQIQTITVLPPGNPTITCPPGMTVECSNDIVLDPNDATVTTDCNLGYNVWISNADISGAPDCNGTTYTYTYNVVDDCGNTAQCEQVFTIQHDPPVIICPAGSLVECFDEIDVDPLDAVVTGSCNPNPEITILPVQVDGPMDCPGTTYTYTYQLNDGCGNNVSCDQVFIVGQNDEPTIIAPLDITCECLAGVNPNPDHAVVTTACGNNVDYEVLVSDPVINGPQDCPGTTYTYTFTVMDACGRAASDIQVFTVSNGPPVFDNCPGDDWLQLNCEDYGGEEGTIEVIEAWIASITARSSCGVPLTVLNDFDPDDIGTCTEDGFTVVTFFATDDCGRTTTCEGTVVVTDTEGPDFTNEAEDHFEMCTYNTPLNFQNWVANHANAEAWDGCSGDNISWSTIPPNPTINCGDGTVQVTVTFVATDNCGNASYSTATFTALPQGGDHNLSDPNEEVSLNQNRALPELYQNIPNPFREHTSISLYLPAEMEASIRIYDASGRLLKQVTDRFGEGLHNLEVNRQAFSARGVLFYELKTSYGSITKRMVLIQ